MPNSYRIRTQVGVDKSVTVKIDQDFDLLEILSLKITQSEIYTRACSDYGVIVGRVFVNDGYGLPNAKVSVFIPLSAEDENNPIISTLYPYKTVTDLNEDGYRYNLLPYVQSYSNHVPTGSFPDRVDVLINRSLIEVYDKYYKFTVKTNDSGDFMIFGVPVGQHQLFMDIDLSDIGQFSLAPQDMIRMGLATEQQVDGLKFKASSNLYELPQIQSLVSSVDVLPLWGDPDICQFSITRNDFDLAELGITFQPTAIFMGSLISTSEKYAVKKYNFSRELCKVRIKTGELCRLVTGPGEIVAIRQTILNDNLGRPVLEQYQFGDGGKVIDENGAWLVDLPMNMDFVITDEFGNQIISNDPTKGVPTTAKYRFKIKWEQPTNQNNEIQRGYFLVPNVKEWGWESSGQDEDDPNFHQKTGPGGAGASPIVPYDPAAYQALQYNYSFSLNWDDYGDPTQPYYLQQINEAISCDDRFFKFYYNKVYTVGQFIDQYRGGRGARKFNSIKNILDDACEDTINPFPTNDAQFQGDFLYLLFTIFLKIFTPVLIVIMIIQHILAFLLYLLRPIIWFVAILVGYVTYGICKTLNAFKKLFGGKKHDCKSPSEIQSEANELANLYKIFTNVALPNLSYPDCEMCNCKVGPAGYDTVDPNAAQMANYQSLQNISILSNWNENLTYDRTNDHISDTNEPHDWWPSSTYAQFVTTLMSGFPFSGTPNGLPGGNTDSNAPLKDFTTVLYGAENVKYTYKQHVTVGHGCGTDNSEGYHYRNRRWVTPNLPMAERMNLFNTKAKYFNSVALGGSPNDGGTATFQGDVLPTGVNQIRSTFNSVVNNGPNDWHLDNVMVLSCDDGTIGDFSSGKLVFFNGAQFSSDVNALSASTNNDLGLPCITGQTIIGSTVATANTTYSTTVTFADPNNPNNTLSKTYAGIDAKIDDTEYHRWPVDIEYFQVITAMTVNQFLSFSNPNSPPNSFPKRFLNNQISLYKYAESAGSGNGNPPSNWLLGYDSGQVYKPFVFADYPYPDQYGNQCNQFYGYSSAWLNQLGTLTNPISGSSLGGLQVIVILVRGVDPYSTRNTNTYDISKLFGYNFGNIKITGKFKLNIPIQQGVRNAKHDQFPNNSSTSFYSNTSIFYDTFNYLPGNQYSAFTSNLISYYSAFDVSTSNLGVFPAAQSSNFCFTSPITQDVRVKGSPISSTNTTNGNISFPTNGYNLMSADFTYRLDDQSNMVERAANYCTTNDKHGFEAEGNWTLRDNYYSNTTKGYYRNESVEGGSLLSLAISQQTQSSSPNERIGRFCRSCRCDGNAETYYPRWNNQTDPRGFYYSFGYDKNTVQVNYGISLARRRKIIMRSDRLPTSTTQLNNKFNSYVLHQNPGFAIYVVDDDGTAITVPAVTIGFNDVEGDQASGETVSQFANVIDSLNECDKMAPLKCYYTSNTPIPDEIKLDYDYPSDKWNGTCTTFESASITRPIFALGNGCYLLVTRPILSIKVDLLLLLEWKSRIDLTFAACRNVFGHLFTNNWINGVLYAYSFKHDILFTSPFKPNGNSPVSTYCYDTIYYHPTTQNFFYRSSPYNGTSNRFIGKNGRSAIGGNIKYINNPTTIVNLGARAPYLNQLVLTNVFDDYNMDNVNPTTFRETFDIINIFILSRLLNANFWNLLFGSNGAGVFGLFSRVRRSVTFNPKQKNFVDGDFAQLISINSEIGVRGFDSDNVGDGQNPVIVQLGTNPRETIIGLYFDADMQTRDFVTPHRKIYNTYTLIGNPAAFDSIPITTQIVPFYGWRVNQNDDPTIFGTQQNDWHTTNVKGLNYQLQDRVNLFQAPLLTPYTFNFNYMQSVDFASVFTDYYRGYIYAVEPIAPLPPFFQNFEVTNNPTKVWEGIPQEFQVGAPFHFYFGLIKGSTAYDRFRTKWIEGEIII